MLREIF